MTEWITVKDKKEDQIEKKVENEWIKKKIKPEEKLIKQNKKRAVVR